MPLSAGSCPAAPGPASPARHSAGTPGSEDAAHARSPLEPRSSAPWGKQHVEENSGDVEGEEVVSEKFPSRTIFG